MDLSSIIERVQKPLTTHHTMHHIHMPLATSKSESASAQDKRVSHTATKAAGRSRMPITSREGHPVKRNDCPNARLQPQALESLWPEVEVGK